MGRVLGMVCKWGGFWVWCENGEGFGYGVQLGSVWGIVEMVVIMGMVKIQVTMI